MGKPVGELEVFISIVGETPAVRGRLVLSSPLTSSQGKDCWWYWVPDGLLAQESREQCRA